MALSSRTTTMLTMFNPGAPDQGSERRVHPARIDRARELVCTMRC